jgi:hypothetical protein
MGLNLSKKLVKCYIWSRALCGAETWTLRKVDQKILIYGGYRPMETIRWTDRLKNRGQEYPTYNKKEGRPRRFITSCVGTAF